MRNPVILYLKIDINPNVYFVQVDTRPFLSTLCRVNVNVYLIFNQQKNLNIKSLKCYSHTLKYVIQIISYYPMLSKIRKYFIDCYVTQLE